MNKLCSICMRFVEETFTVHNNNLEPFTSIDPMEGLVAWGGYGVARTLLCVGKDFVHFKFDHDGGEHLVFMKEYNPKALQALYDDWQDHPEPCQHEDCFEPGIACRFAWELEAVEEWLCHEHAPAEGYCSNCGVYSAGTEGFDFEHPGWCNDCYAALQDELDDEDDWEDEGYDDFSYSTGYDMIEGETYGVDISPDNDTMGSTE